MNKIKGYIFLGKLLGLFSLFPCYSEAATLKVWVDGAGRIPFAPDSLLLPEAFFGSAVFGHCLELTDGKELIPSMVETFKWDFQSKQYALRLKENLHFHNGREITASDLEFSILRGLFSPSKSFALSQLSDLEGIDAALPKRFVTGAVAGVKVISKYQLNFKLKEYNPQFLHFLTYSYYSPIPKEELEDDYFTWKSKPVGGGLFKVETVNKTKQTITLKRVNEGEISTVEMQYGETPDGPDLLLGSELNRLETKVDASKYTASFNSSFNLLAIISFNSKNSLAQKVEFRASIANVIDRNTLSSNTPASAPAFELLPPRFWGRLGLKSAVSTQKVKLLNNYKHQLLKIEIPIIGAKFSPKFKESFFNMLQKLNIVATFTTGGKFRASLKKNVPFVLISQVQDSMDPIAELSLFRSTSPMSTYNTNKEKMEDLFESVAKTRETDLKTQKVRNISEHILNDFTAIPLLFRYSEIWSNKMVIATLGDQNAGAEFYLDRLKMVPNWKTTNDSK